MQRRPTCFETWTGQLRTNLAGFARPKLYKKKIIFFVQFKPKSTRYKEKLAVDVFRTSQAAREQNVALLDPRRVFKYLDLHYVRSLIKS